MSEDITLVLQILILAMLSWTTWSIYRTGNRTKRQMAMLEAYRREIRWLTDRVEQLEARPAGVVKFK